MAAQNEARAAHNDEVGTTHLVLGLLSEPEGLAAAFVKAQGITLEDVRRAATEALPPAVTGELPEIVPYDAGARKALELTFREALRMGHNYIGTEHVLLALLEQEDGAGVLTGLGIDKATAESGIAEALTLITAPPEKG